MSKVKLSFRIGIQVDNTIFIFLILSLLNNVKNKTPDTEITHVT